MRKYEADLRLQLALDAAAVSAWDATIIGSSFLQGEITLPAHGMAMLGLTVRDQAQPASLPHGRFIESVHPDDRQFLQEKMQIALDSPGRQELLFRVVWPDSSVHWLALRADIFCDERGIPSRSLGLIWDVTAQQQAQHVTFSRMTMAEMTLGSIGDGVLTTDARGVVQSMNRIAEHLTGWASEDAIGTSIEKVFPVVDEVSDAIYENPVLKCLRLDQTIAITNHSALISRNGHRIGIMDTTAPIRNSTTCLPIRSFRSSR